MRILMHSGERSGGGGVAIDHRAEIARTSLEPVALTQAGPSALRLSATDGRSVRVLWASRATADSLLAAFAAAKASVSAATTHTTRDARANGRAQHVLIRRIHRLIRRIHRLIRRVHLLIRRIHVLIRRSPRSLSDVMDQGSQS